MVKLADGYTISTKDGLCYVLRQKRRPKPTPGVQPKKDEVEEVVGYHSTIAGAIRMYRERLILAIVENEKLTLQALVDRIEETDRKIGKLMCKKGLGELAVDDAKAGSPDRANEPPAEDAIPRRKPRKRTNKEDTK